MNIRPCHPKDRRPIIDIMNQAIQLQANAYLELFNENSGTLWFQQVISTAEHFVLAEVDEKPIGWASLMPYRRGRGALSGVSEITFYIHKEHYRKGVASRLIEHLENEARSESKTHLLAILLDDNEASKSLLEKHQFKIWGHLPDVAIFGEDRKGQFYMGKGLASERVDEYTVPS